MRSLDHIVHVVDDLDGAAAVMQALGFTVTDKATHPFGTANRCIQIGRSYWELLSIENRAKIVPHTETKFSFSADVAHFHEEVGAGLSAIVGSSANADTDRAHLEKIGLPAFEPNEFGRMAKGPDGVERPVSFRVVHTELPDAPFLSLFFNHHQQPENFWFDELSMHANGARQIAELHIAAERAEAVADNLGRALQVRPGAESGGHAIALDKTTIWVYPPQTLCDRFNVEIALDPSTMPRLLGVTVLVDDVAAIADRAEAGGLQGIKGPNRVVVSPAVFAGGFLAFKQD